MANGDISMNYTYLNEAERIQIAEQILHAQEANIFRQEMLIATEPLVQAHKDKLAAQIAVYDKLAAAAPKKVIVNEPVPETN